MRHQVSFEQLLDYVEDRLPAAEAEEVATHLQSGCTGCAEDVAWLRRALGLMAADEMVSAPPAVVARVQSMYRPPERQAAPALAGLWGWLRKATWVPGAAQLRYAGAIALATVLILSGAWWGWGNTTVAQAATLSEVQGPVEVRLPGSDEWQPAAQGMILMAGSELRSGEQGTATLLYADGSCTELTEDAQLEILSLTGQRNGQSTTARLSLSAGLTQHRLIRSKSLVQVEAGGAIAEGHRGNYEVRVRDAEVEVRAGDGNVSLRVNGTTTNLATGARGRVKGSEVQITAPPRGQPAERGQGAGNGVGRGQQPKEPTPALGTPKTDLKKDKPDHPQEQPAAGSSDPKGAGSQKAPGKPSTAPGSKQQSANGRTLWLGLSARGNGKR